MILMCLLILLLVLFFLFWMFLKDELYVVLELCDFFVDVDCSKWEDLEFLEIIDFFVLIIFDCFDILFFDFLVIDFCLLLRIDVLGWDSFVFEINLLFLFIDVFFVVLVLFEIFIEFFLWFFDICFWRVDWFEFWDLCLDWDVLDVFWMMFGLLMEKFFVVFVLFVIFCFVLSFFEIVFMCLFFVDCCWVVVMCLELFWDFLLRLRLRFVFMEFLFLGRDCFFLKEVVFFFFLF